MASVDLTRCGCVEISFGTWISKTLLEVEAPRSVKQFRIRGCLIRQNPIALPQAIKREKNVILEEITSRALTRLRAIGMPALDQSFRHGNVATQRGRWFPQRAVPLLSLGDASSLSQTIESSSFTSEETNASETSTLSTNGNTERWFPYKDCFKLDNDLMRTLTSSDVISLLSPILGDERIQRIEGDVANRTYSACLAIEGLLDLGNISAIIRSADAFGFQSAHVITNRVKTKRYKGNRTGNRGNEKWLDTEIWDDTSECIATLRKRGYRIAVT